MNHKKIKITHILAELGFGGAERLLLDLIRSIDREVFEIEVVCVIRSGAFADELTKEGIPVKVIGKKDKLGLKALWQIRKYLLESQPDIVHTHLFAGDFWGKIGARLAGIKHIVSTEHNLNISEGWLKDLIKTWTNSFTDKIIAVSQAVKNYTIKKYKTSADKIEVVYNGIDLSRFDPKILDFDKDKIIFGNIGRLTEQKGQKYLIKAFVRVAEKLSQAELWIVGAGELKIALENQVAKLNLTEKVKFLGTRKNIPELMDEFDIFVMSSLWEGLGIAVIEAMAKGLPIVASNVDGIAELIENNKNGILVEPKSVDELAEAMLKLINDKNLAITISQQARQRAVADFDLNKLVKKYEEIYKNVLKS